MSSCLEDIIVIDFLQKIFSLCWGWMTNKMGQIYQRNVRHTYIFLRLHFGSRSMQSGTFIFKMAEMLQIPQVFPLVSCLGSAKAVQCPRPEPKIGDKSQQIPRYSLVCPWGQPPGMAADKCIIKWVKQNCGNLWALNWEYFKCVGLKRLMPCHIQGIVYRYCELHNC